MISRKHVQSWHPIRITQHAKLRLRERVVSYAGYRDWEDLVKTARDKGKAPAEMTSYEYSWCVRNIDNFKNSSPVRILNGFAFIFGGGNSHARKLITVIRLN